VRTVQFRQGIPSYETHFMRQARLAGVMRDQLHLSGVRTPLMSMAARAGVQVLENLDEDKPEGREEKVPVAPELAETVGKTAAEQQVELNVNVPDDASSIMEEESVHA